MAAANLYDLLGIDKSASAEEVRKAYKQKALETHPDKFLEPGASEKQKQEASDRFHRVRQAFEILNDPQRRKSYDVGLKNKNVNVNTKNIRPPDYNDKKKKKDAGMYVNTTNERQKRLQKDREEWSRRIERQYQERMAALEERSRMAGERLLQKEREAAEHQIMVDEMLQELHRLNPEWEARKKSVERLKAERDRLAAATTKGLRQIQTRSS